jgi:hypothetical protein
MITHTFSQPKMSISSCGPFYFGVDQDDLHSRGSSFPLLQLLNPLHQPLQPTLIPINQQALHHTRPTQKD